MVKCYPGQSTVLCFITHTWTHWFTKYFFSKDVDLKKRVDESARIKRTYGHYFDLTIVNDNLDAAFETLQAALDKLYSEPQWVPVGWVYWRCECVTCAAVNIDYV